MSRKKTKVPGQLSVSDFKQWLAGVEDMQPSGWSPDVDQWKKIRAKIDLLNDEPEVVESPQQVQQQPHWQQPHWQQPGIPPGSVYRSPPNGESSVLFDSPQQPGRAMPQQSLGDEIFIPKAAPSELAGVPGAPTDVGGRVGPDFSN